MSETERLAAKAAALWLEWSPSGPEMCPARVADAVTEWAEAMARDLETTEERK